MTTPLCWIFYEASVQNGCVLDAHAEFDNRHDDERYSRFLHERPTEFWKTRDPRTSLEYQSEYCNWRTPSTKGHCRRVCRAFCENVRSKQLTINLQPTADCAVGLTMVRGTGVSISAGSWSHLSWLKSLCLKLLRVRNVVLIIYQSNMFCMPIRSAITNLCRLFSLMMWHKYVLASLGAGTIVSLVKIILETSMKLAIIDLTLWHWFYEKYLSMYYFQCQDCLVIDKLQFSFKHDLRSDDTFFALFAANEHFGSAKHCSDIMKDIYEHFQYWLIVFVFSFYWSAIFVQSKVLTTVKNGKQSLVEKKRSWIQCPSKDHFS